LVDIAYKQSKTIGVFKFEFFGLYFCYFKLLLTKFYRHKL